MISQSKWKIEYDSKTNLIRATTLKPRVDYAVEIVDILLDILVQKRQELDRKNLELYRRNDETHESLEILKNQIKDEFEISFIIESLRQIRRSLDSIVGLGNLPVVLSPTVSVVRTLRSRMLGIMPQLDSQLGELSLLIGGIIIDSAHLASANLDFGVANEISRRLLDEAKLIADSKINKQFPNVDLS
jgi:hypothetical protein